MKLLSVLSTSLDKFNRLVVKAWNGKSDTRTAKQYAPAGVDSNPIKNMIALYTRTELDGSEAIFGYLNKNCMAQAGEIRFFSTDNSGNQEGYVWLKNTGILELNGNSNNAVKYNESKTELDALKKSVNDLVSAFNQHIHPTPGGASSPPTAVPSVIPATPNASNFANIKNAYIQTI